MQGRKDGAAAVNMGEGFLFGKMEEWKSNGKLRG
jgi:hypothetical protein